MERGPCLAAATLVVLLSVAGCTAPPGPTSEALAEDGLRKSRGYIGGDAVGTATGHCVGLGVLLLPPVEEVQAQLPAGYTAQPYAMSVLLGEVTVFALRCASLTIGDVTEAEVRLAWVDAWAEEVHSYRWDFFVDEPEPYALATLLESQGWPVQRAAITLDDRSFTVEAPDRAFEVAVPVIKGTGDAGIIHAYGVETVGPTGAVHGLNETFGSGADFLSFSGARVDARGGALGALQASFGGPMPGAGNALSSEWSGQVLAPRPAS